MPKITHRFVEFIPDVIEERTLYISIKYCTVVHKCICGCGNEVVTPLSPTDWEIRFNGKTVSLNPSIGNWNFDCKSHYWISNNKVILAEQWSKIKIERNRRNDKLEKDIYFNDIIDLKETKKTNSKKSFKNRIGFWKKKSRKK
jgi:hypothetical protein